MSAGAFIPPLERFEKEGGFSRKFTVFLVERFYRRQIGQLIFVHAGKLVVGESAGVAVSQMRLRDHVIGQSA